MDPIYSVTVDVTRLLWISVYYSLWFFVSLYLNPFKLDKSYRTGYYAYSLFIGFVFGTICIIIKICSFHFKW